MDDENKNYWRKCSSCKKEILYSTRYYTCSVSTCNGQRTGYVFCSVPCFERHLPGARHKDAAAIEAHSPSKNPMPATSTNVPTISSQRRIISTSSTNASSAPHTATANASSEVLVIASRLKDYIHARSEYNTSASVMDTLSQHLRQICDRAIENARAEGRKTVMDRDFQFLKNFR